MGMSLDKYCYELLVDKKKPPEQWARQGKAEWPHQVRIVIPRGRLLGLAILLIQMFRFDDDTDDFVLHGELREDEDE